MMLILKKQNVSVVVKEDKKLLTVLFPNGRDGRSEGRAFTLKVSFSFPFSVAPMYTEKIFSFILLCVSL